MFNWNFGELLGSLLAAFLAVILTFFGIGCAPKATELERFSDKLLDNVIGPTVQKALTETATRTATLQAAGQAIEPGYLVEVEAFWGTGVKAKTEVTLVGVSGQLMGHAQGDQGPDIEGGYGGEPPGQSGPPGQSELPDGPGGG